MKPAGQRVTRTNPTPPPEPQVTVDSFGKVFNSPTPEVFLVQLKEQAGYLAASFASGCSASTRAQTKQRIENEIKAIVDDVEKKIKGKPKQLQLKVLRAVALAIQSIMAIPATEVQETVDAGNLSKASRATAARFMRMMCSIGENSAKSNFLIGLKYIPLFLSQYIAYIRQNLVPDIMSGKTDKLPPPIYPKTFLDFIKLGPPRFQEQMKRLYKDLMDREDPKMRYGETDEANKFRTDVGNFLIADIKTIFGIPADKTTEDVAKDNALKAKLGNKTKINQLARTFGHDVENDDKGAAIGIVLKEIPLSMGYIKSGDDYNKIDMLRELANDAIYLRMGRDEYKGEYGKITDNILKKSIRQLSADLAAFLKEPRNKFIKLDDIRVQGIECDKLGRLSVITKVLFERVVRAPKELVEKILSMPEVLNKRRAEESLHRIWGEVVEKIPEVGSGKPEHEMLRKQVSNELGKKLKGLVAAHTDDYLNDHGKPDGAVVLMNTSVNPDKTAKSNVPGERVALDLNKALHDTKNVPSRFWDRSPDAILNGVRKHVYRPALKAAEKQIEKGMKDNHGQPITMTSKLKDEIEKAAAKTGHKILDDANNDPAAFGKKKVTKVVIVNTAPKGQSPKYRVSIETEDASDCKEGSKPVVITGEGAFENKDGTLVNKTVDGNGNIWTAKLTVNNNGSKIVMGGTKADAKRLLGVFYDFIELGVSPKAARKLTIGLTFGNVYAAWPSIVGALGAVVGDPHSYGRAGAYSVQPYAGAFLAYKFYENKRTGTTFAVRADAGLLDFMQTPSGFPLGNPPLKIPHSPSFQALGVKVVGELSIEKGKTSHNLSIGAKAGQNVDIQYSNPTVLGSTTGGIEGTYVLKKGSWGANLTAGFAKSEAGKLGPQTTAFGMHGTLSRSFLKDRISVGLGFFLSKQIRDKNPLSSLVAGGGVAARGWITNWLGLEANMLIAHDRRTSDTGSGGLTTGSSVVTDAITMIGGGMNLLLRPIRKAPMLTLGFQIYRVIGGVPSSGGKSIGMVVFGMPFDSYGYSSRRLPRRALESSSEGKDESGSPKKSASESAKPTAAPAAPKSEPPAKARPKADEDGDDGSDTVD